MVTWLGVQQKGLAWAVAVRGELGGSFLFSSNALSTDISNARLRPVELVSSLDLHESWASDFSIDVSGTSQGKKTRLVAAPLAI